MPTPSPESIARAEKLLDWHDSDCAVHSYGAENLRVSCDCLRTDAVLAVAAALDATWNLAISKALEVCPPGHPITEIRRVMRTLKRPTDDGREDADG